MRIEEHPILGNANECESFLIYVDGEPVEAREGETIAAAMLAERLRVCRTSTKTHETRGIFCGIGQCTDCVMQVNGVPNIRTCVTQVTEGMQIKRQEGVGVWEVDDEQFED